MDQNIPRRYTDKELGLSSGLPPMWAIVAFCAVAAVASAGWFKLGMHLGSLIR